MNKVLASLALCLLVSGNLCNLSAAPDLKNTYQQQKAKQKQLQREENDRYDWIIDSRDLDDYNQFLRDYPRSKKCTEIRNRISEIMLYRDATKSNTIDSYQRYINNTKYGWYTADATDKINTLRRENERRAFDEVKRINTIEAYENYLRKNPNSGYREEAEKLIKDLKAVEEWKTLANSSSIVALNQYISNYPNSPYVANAQRRVSELKGAQAYAANNLSTAYDEFQKVGRANLSQANQLAYDRCQEYVEYSKLSRNSNLSALETFVRSYPYSTYTPTVKNYIAYKKADELSMYSTDYDFNNALSYASDSSTRNYVNSRINSCKEAYKQHIKWQKSYERKENGGSMQFGWTIADMQYMLVSDDYDTSEMSLNMGLGFRWGNYMDRVRFSLGIYPGVYAILYDDNEYDSEGEYKFHMPVKAQLDLRLFKKFYIFGGLNYNMVRDKEIEGDFGWRAGIGWSFKHADFNIYYGQQMNNPYYQYVENYHYDSYYNDYYYQGEWVEKKKTIGFVGLTWTLYWRMF